MKTISKFIFMIFLLIIALMAGIGTRVWFNQFVAFTPKIEKFNDIPLIHNEAVVIQQKGLDVVIKNATISTTGYTGSMIPTLYGGNKVIIRPYPYYRIKQEGYCNNLTDGQIAVYVDKEMIGNPLIVHRIIDSKIGDGMVRFKGDNNVASEFVSCESIKYIVIGILYQ